MDLIDRTKPLSVGIGVRPLERRLYHANPTSLKILVRAACRDQQSMNAKNAIPRGCEPTSDLPHEQLIGKERGANDLHAARGEVDHEYRVVA